MGGRAKHTRGPMLMVRMGYMLWGVCVCVCVNIVWRLRSLGRIASFFNDYLTVHVHFLSLGKMKLHFWRAAYFLPLEFSVYTTAISFPTIQTISVCRLCALKCYGITWLIWLIGIIINTPLDQIRCSTAAVPITSAQNLKRFLPQLAPHRVVLWDWRTCFNPHWAMETIWFSVVTLLDCCMTVASEILSGSYIVHYIQTDAHN